MLKLPKKWRIHDVFHVSLLEQDTTKKERVNDTQLDFEFEAGNNEKYEVDGIWDSTVYAKKSTTGQMPGLYYLVLWKGYPKEENTWEPVSAIQHFWRLINTYHKNNPKRSTATSPSVDMALPMARPTTTLTKKHSRSAKFTTTTKRAKKS